MREFTAVELEAYLEHAEPHPFMLDVRQPWEYDLCRLDNCQLIPMGQVPNQLDELDKDRETVVICHHGIRSRQVGYFLEQAGFTNIINLRGGVNDWARNVDSTMSTY